MLALGLIASVCYISGLTGTAIPPQWVLLSFILPYWLWETPSWSIFHSLFLAFAGWATLSLAWTPSTYDGLYELWLIGVWFSAFHFGYSMADVRGLRSLRRLWHGLCLGACANIAIAIAQHFGSHWVPSFDDGPAGLLYNSTVLGALCCICLAACLAHRLWWYVPILTLGLVLSGSRGAIAVALILTFAHFLGRISALGLALAVAIYATLHLVPDSSDAMRLEIWRTAFSHETTWHGWGVGAFSAFYFPHLSHTTSQLIHPEFMHNDPLQLWFNYGPGAIVLFGLFAFGLACPGPDRIPLSAIALLSAFWFPLYSPLIAFIAFATLGRLLASNGHLVLTSGLRRCDPRLWPSPLRSIRAQLRREPIPLQPHH